tara:strand:- start:1168 stop:1461 length:294 start_codon:yes stop_codon:yes gene_type:complete
LRSKFPSGVYTVSIDFHKRFILITKKGEDMRKTHEEWNRFTDAWIEILKDTYNDADDHIKFKLGRIISIVAEDEDDSKAIYDQHIKEIAANNAFSKL